MRRKLLALFGVTAVALVGAVAFAAGPAQAATPATVANATSLRTQCEFPDDQVEALDQVSKVSAEDKLSKGLLEHVLRCLDYEVVDMCDGRTVVTAVNWAVSDNKWTRLTFEILGKDYVVKGGPDHTPVVVTLGPPGVEDVQVYLVFEGENDGTTWRIEKPLLEELYDWELPKACPTATATASPSPSVTVSVSPSPVVVVTTTTAPGPQLADPDLPTTGDSLLKPTVSAGVAIALGLLLVGSVLLKRRRTAAEAANSSSEQE